MDLEEKILKLAALGWDGKEEPVEFLKREYGIICRFEEKTSKLEISFKKGSHFGYIQHIIITNNYKPDLISFCLRLFKTENGDIIGPDLELSKKEDKEWT